MFWIITFAFLLFPATTSADDGCLIVVNMPAYQVFFGSQIPTYSYEECRSHCITNDSCAAFDWDRGNPGCFYFNKFEEDPSENELVDHYILIRNQEFCTGDFLNETWLPDINKASTGRKTLTALKSLVLCVETCLSDSYCKSVDWNQKTQSCWVVNKTGYITESSGTYHYERIRVPNMPDIEDLAIPPLPFSSPYAIKPAYIVIIGLGLGCILMTLTAIVALFSRRRKSHDKVENYETFQKINFSKEDEFSTIRKYHEGQFGTDKEILEAEQVLDTY